MDLSNIQSQGDVVLEQQPEQLHHHHHHPTTTTRTSTNDNNNINNDSSNNITSDITATTSPSTTNTIQQQPQQYIYTIGQFVSVQSRTSPGINQPGGIGRITNVTWVDHDTTNNNNNDPDHKKQYVSVKYLLDSRHEKNIDVIYVSLYSYEDTNASTTTNNSRTSRRPLLRDRNMLLGRCTYCGSLRTDCLSCDFTIMINNMEQTQTQQQKSNDTINQAINVTKSKKKNGKTNVHNTNNSNKSNNSSTDDSDNNDSDVSEEQYEHMIRQHRREYIKYKRLLQKVESNNNIKRIKMKTTITNNNNNNKSQVQQQQLQRKQNVKKQRNQKMIHNRRNTQNSISILEAAIMNGDDDDEDDNDDNDSDINIDKLIQNNQKLILNHQHYSTTNMNQYDSDDDDNNNDNDSIRSTIHSVTKSDSSSSSSNSSSGNDRFDNVSLHQLVALQQRNVLKCKNKRNNTLPTAIHHFDDHNITIEEVDDDFIINNNNNFIQPEGDANQLPNDMYDTTQSISYSELIPYFDTIIQRIENIDLPNAKQHVVSLEKEYKKYIHNNYNNNNNNNVNNQNQLERIKTLQQKCMSLHDEMIQKLIRNGYDQCQSALRKLTSKKYYKRYRNEYIEKQKNNTGITLTLVPFIGHNDDTREFKLDAINDMIEELLSKLRYYSKVLLSKLNIDDDDKSLSSTNSFMSATSVYNTNNGNDNSPNSPDSIHFVQMDKTTKAQNDHDPFDLHPFASKKRRKKTIITMEGNIVKKTRRKERKIFIQGSINTKTTSLKHRNNTDDDLSVQSESVPINNDDEESVDVVYDNGYETHRKTKQKSRNKNSKKPPQELDSNDVYQSGDMDENEDSESFFGPISDVPDIEAILQTSKTDVTNTLNHKHEIPRSKAESRKISERMGKWLQANNCDPNSLDDAENDDPQIGLQDYTRKRQKGQTIKRNASTRFDDSNVMRSVPPATTQETKDYLFASLYDSQSIPSHATSDPFAAHVRLESNLKQICTNVVTIQSSDSLQRKLNDICDWFEDGGTYTTADVTLAFQTLLELLSIENEFMILQDLVSTESQSIQRFVCIIVTLLRLIQRNINHSLSSNDGKIYDIFGIDRCKVFINFVFLQLVDTAMSLFQPIAWDLRIQDTRKILQLLEPMRNELAHHMNLVERVTVCLAEELPQQEWRCVRDGNGVYVSSINPDDWFDLLSSGTTPKSTSTVRFASFEDNIPRCEVDAVWCLIAYFAGTKNSPQCTDSNRWIFPTQLLLKGSLSTFDKSEQSPPELEQVEAAIGDLRNIIDLILCGAMGTIPKRDNILIDLIHRAISLERDYIQLNPISHQPGIPTARQKNVFNVVAALCESRPTNMQLGNSCYTFRRFIKELVCDEVEISWMGQPLLVPSSRLLRCCLGLLLVWKKQIPSDKAKRLQCFENAMKTFVRTMADTSSVTISDTTKTGNLIDETDAFSAAFESLHTDVESPKEQSVLFENQCAAYILLFLSFSFNSENDMWQGISHGDNSAIPYSLIWEIVSDSEMQSRQKWIVSGNNESQPKPRYIGNISRLYVAANVMSSLGIVLLGENPLNRNIYIRPKTCPTDSERYSSLIFVYSCLIASLDCACDLPYKPEVLSSILVTTTTIARLLDNERVHCVGENSQSLQNHPNFVSLVDMITKTSVITRCFYLVVSSSNCYTSNDQCFQSVIAFIRVFLDHAPSKKPLEGLLTDSVEEDDPFDDIDDDALANLDLGTEKQEAVESLLDPLELLYSIYSILVSALEFAKPTNRTAVFSCDENTAAIQISSQGVKLVNKNLEMICDMLAKIASTHWHPTCPIKLLWNTNNNVYDDQENTEYFKNLAIILSQKICQNNESSIVHQIIWNDCESFLFNALDSIMNLKILQRIPSCNLDRIASRSGSVAEEQAFNELVDFRNGIHTKVRKGLQEMKEYCGNLSKILIATSNDRDTHKYNALIGRILKTYSSDRPHTQLVPSLENECFHRLSLFQRLIRECAIQINDITKVERLTVHLLLVCTSGLIRLLLKIGIQDQAHLDVHGHSYSLSKLYETVACWTELDVNLLLEMFSIQRYRTDTLSDNFVALKERIRGCLTSPILHGKDISFVSRLRDVMVDCVSFLKSEKHNVGQIGVFALSNYDMKTYIDIFRNAFIRRSREVVLSVSAGFNEHPNAESFGLMFDMYTAGISHGTDVATMIGCSFGVSSFYNNSTYYEQINAMSRSPLAVAIDDEYSKMETSNQLSEQQKQCLVYWKSHGLQRFAIPKLSGLGNMGDSTTKVLLFRFVQSILDRERVDRMGIDVICMDFDATLPCLLLKEIGVALLSELFHKTVINETLIMMSYTCARSVMNLRADCVEPKSVGWLVDWACPSSTSSTNTANSDYIWYVLCWIRDLGALILDKSSGKLKKLREHNSPSASESTTISRITWVPLDTSENQLQTTRRLNDLEEKLFPSASTSTNSIVNKYAQCHQRVTTNTNKHIESKQDDITFDTWIPSVDVCATIHQLMDKMKFASSSRDIPSSID